MQLIDCSQNPASVINSLCTIDVIFNVIEIKCLNRLFLSDVMHREPQHDSYCVAEAVGNKAIFLPLTMNGFICLFVFIIRGR